MPRALRIDFVSDVVCPWCVVGLRSLAKALEVMGDEVSVDFHFQPFELNPNMPLEGQNIAEHVREKYGSSPERSAGVRNELRKSGEALGFVFNSRPDDRIWNTFDAHRLLHWAGEEGRQRQLKEALFEAAFTNNLSVSDHEVLVRAATDAGLDPREARSVLASGRFGAEVRAAEAYWRDQGIAAVPSIVFDGRWLIQGGQPPQVFEDIIRKILARPAETESSAGLPA